MNVRIAITSFLNFFRHHLLQEDEPDFEKRGRKKLFAIFLLILGVPLFFVGINHLLVGLIAYGLVNVLLASFLIILVFTINSIKWVMHIYRVVCLLFWLLLFYWVYTAPRYGFPSIWTILYPIFVFFLLGKREGFIWSATMVITCAVVMFNPFHLLDVYDYPVEFSGRLMGTQVFVFFLTYYYESVRVRYKDALDKDRSELQAHRDNLEVIIADRTDELRRKNIELKNALDQLQETTARYVLSQREKEKIQELLAHSQKMEAVGTLAGGLAHDFNNLLGGIIGSFNLLEILLKKENLERRQDIEEYLWLGIESSKKSAVIIKQLLTLSRRQDISLTPVDINDSLRNILSICKNSFAKSITLDFKYFVIPVIVLAEPIYMEQVLLNLCINGAHAMTTMRGPEGPQGGTLTVILDIVIPDETLLMFEPELARADSWARIRVIDTGVGIAEENRARIFEPFFTTKKAEGGSGLGLAISYGIVQQHRGFISVQSTEKSGSMFSVYLPLADGNSITVKEHLEASGTHVAAGPGRILVIDDETYILDVVQGFLEAYGWNVITANTPERGLALYQEHQGGISAVILDLSMPGKSGIEVFKELKAIDPGVKVILCSGLIENDVRESAITAGIKKILHKPFDADSLMDALDELMRQG